MSALKRFTQTISKKDKILNVIKFMKANKANKFISGIAVIADKNGTVAGLVTDGDIRRGLQKGVSLEDNVSKIANLNPILINKNLSTENRARAFELAVGYNPNSNILKTNKMILVDDKNKLFDVVILNSTTSEFDIENKLIAVYGLGFVGLTLAATLANNGLKTVGIDSNKKTIAGLKKGKIHFFEKGLQEMLFTVKQINPIKFHTDLSVLSPDVHIVCVGTPVNKLGKPDLHDNSAVTRLLIKKIKKNDLIIFRSTLPVGTMRNIILPELEKSGLVCGQDFDLSFAPERTVAGNALKELVCLPQIVGSINKKSSKNSMILFNKITNTTIEVGSLEEAELIKLLNNTFRDITFSFANEVANICDNYNINAFNLIHAANNGYIRNKIATPSPGVGGTCLSKDPFIYSNPLIKNNLNIKLGKISREINSQGGKYVYSKIKRFTKFSKISVKSLKILVVGIAFKGDPETSDIRGSASLDLLKLLGKSNKIALKDYVIDKKALTGLGYKVISDPVGKVVRNFDAVIYMNNHRKNIEEDVLINLRDINKPFLFFDGWNMFNHKEVESISQVIYATMGYFSIKKRINK
ncbi:MAG: nucleotide sugar dehydrogenase [Pseudomonadota bacterium]|nr:nucleotide sugar dehydrogenase [Pseudomonadota bacterium]